MRLIAWGYLKRRRLDFEETLVPEISPYGRRRAGAGEQPGAAVGVPVRSPERGGYRQFRSDLILRLACHSPVPRALSLKDS